MGGWHRAQEEKEYMSDDDDVIDKIKDEVGPSHGEVSLALRGPRGEDMKAKHTSRSLVTPCEACTRVCRFDPQNQ